MNLIIPHAYNVAGGIEKGTISLVNEFADLVEKVVLVLPKGNINYFKDLIPRSDKIIFEHFFCTKLSCLKEMSLGYFIKKHKITHCLYMITNFQSVPKISIPISSCIHDLYWLAFPERYSNKFKNRINDNLRIWLDKSAVLFAVSKKTFNDLVEFSPIHKHKIKFIPEASVGAVDDNVKNDIVDFDTKFPIFYYPAGFDYKKRHLLLLEAVYKLALKGYMFKVVFTGEGTENITGDHSLLATGLKSKLSFGSEHKMKQLVDREKCRLFYQEHKKTLEQIILVMGYCHTEIVKALYRCCSCVVLPSSFEGFGLPLAEAITHGCPVICSDIDTFREQVDLYACKELIDFFPNEDVNALAHCLENFLRNPKVRLSPTEVKERFSRWRWKDVAICYINEMQGLR